MMDTTVIFKFQRSLILSQTFFFYITSRFFFLFVLFSRLLEYRNHLKLFSLVGDPLFSPRLGDSFELESVENFIFFVGSNISRLRSTNRLPSLPSHVHFQLSLSQIACYMTESFISVFTILLCLLFWLSTQNCFSNTSRESLLVKMIYFFFKCRLRNYFRIFSFTVSFSFRDISVVVIHLMSVLEFLLYSFSSNNTSSSFFLFYIMWISRMKDFVFRQHFFRLIVIVILLSTLGRGSSILPLILSVYL